MKSLIIISLLLYCLTDSSAQLPSGVRFPPIRDTAVRNLVVTVNAKQEIYIGGEFIHSSKIDSVLKVKLDSLSTNHYSTTVVIIADTAAYYGKVFQIMKAAKINNAKVVVRVD